MQALDPYLLSLSHRVILELGHARYSPEDKSTFRERTTWTRKQAGKAWHQGARAPRTGENLEKEHPVEGWGAPRSKRKHKRLYKAVTSVSKETGNHFLANANGCRNGSGNQFQQAENLPRCSRAFGLQRVIARTVRSARLFCAMHSAEILRRGFTRSPVLHRSGASVADAPDCVTGMPCNIPPRRLCTTNLLQLNDLAVTSAASPRT
jgi:hypothetical protein